MQQVGRVSQSLNITVGTSTLTKASDSVYLGGTLSCEATTDKDIARRVGQAAGIVRNLGSNWKSPNIGNETKVKLYRTLVQSILLYNAETWTLKDEHKRKLQVFEMSVLRRILGVTRRGRRRYINIKKEHGIVRDVLMLIHQMRFLGKSVDMPISNGHVM